MSLSCSCDYDDDVAYWIRKPKDYTKSNNECNCASCNKQIIKDAICIEFVCWANDEGDHGEDLPSLFLCEECSDIYFNLDELGFECIGPQEDMRELLEEYHEVYGG